MWRLTASNSYSMDVLRSYFCFLTRNQCSKGLFSKKVALRFLILTDPTTDRNPSQIFWFLRGFSHYLPHFPHLSEQKNFLFFNQRLLEWRKGNSVSLHLSAEVSRISCIWQFYRFTISHPHSSLVGPLRLTYTMKCAIFLLPLSSLDQF